MKEINETVKVALIKEAKGDKEPSGRIEAVATTWGKREGADGRRFFYKPEGFADWMESFHKEGRPLPMFFNHESMALPVGEWNKFESDDGGMRAYGRIFLNTQAGKDLYNIMKESPEMMDGVSVGAYAEEAQMVDDDGEPLDDDDDESYSDGYFQITKGGLRELSVVMHANNPKAQIMKMECIREDRTVDLKVVEKVLRDAGLSPEHAKTAASVLKQVIDKRDAVIEEASKPVAKRDADAAVIETDELAELAEALEMRELARALDARL